MVGRHGGRLPSHDRGHGSAPIDAHDAQARHQDVAFARIDGDPGLPPANPALGAGTKADRRITYGGDLEAHALELSLEGRRMGDTQHREPDQRATT